MSENDKLEKRKRTTRNICVLVTVVFITVMLILPLFSIIVSSLKEGIGFYIKSVTSAYVLSALKVTVIATVVAVVINTLFGIIAAWVLTRFDFKGKQILATLIDIPFSISPVIVGLAFLFLSGYKMVQRGVWYKCKNSVCHTGCSACNNICNISICIA